jgi:hypothetical protein
MTQLFPKNINLKQATSHKLQALNYYAKAFGLQLSALSFLVTSFGTRIGLLWRRSVQVLFFMASSFRQSFQNRWQMKYERWKKLNKRNTKLTALNFLLPVFHFRFPTFGLRLVAFSLMLCFSAKAQNPPQIDTTIAVTDSANVYYDDSTKIDDKVEEVDTAKNGNRKIMAAIIFLSEDSIKSLRRAKGFEYMAYLDSLLKAKKEVQHEPQQEREKPSFSFWNIGIVKLLCWMVAIGVVAFVLYKLFLGQGGAFSTNAKNNVPQVDMDEEPDMDDLDGQLKRAIQSGNYRLATRYLFLKTLQQLSDRNAISLSSEKTNIQYSQELRGKPYADSFARLCLLYEYVWFGEFNINGEKFASIQQQQQQLAKAI